MDAIASFLNGLSDFFGYTGNEPNRHLWQPPDRIENLQQGEQEEEFLYEEEDFYDDDEYFCHDGDYDEDEMFGKDAIDVQSLIEEVTCPVCLEVPRTGDLLKCPNGHLVCEDDFVKLSQPKICPQYRSSYAPKSKKLARLRCKEARKILDTISLPCRYSTHGCQKKYVQGDLASHEGSCNFKPTPCIYKRYGCHDKPLKADKAKHEEKCPFIPYSCLMITCAIAVPMQKTLVHMQSCHPQIQYLKTTKLGSFKISFPTMRHVYNTNCRAQMKGTLLEFKGRQFYCGLTQAKVDKTWIVSVHFLGGEGEAKQYRVELTANNPQKSGNYLSYDGPVNSVHTLVSGRFAEEFVGLRFPDRLAKLLVNTKNHSIGVMGQLAKLPSF